MTEPEWLTSRNPEQMVQHLLPTDQPPRRFRLFAVACCRCNQSRIRDGRCQTAIEVAELYADRVVKLADLQTTDAVVRDGLYLGGWNAVAAEAVAARPCHLVASATLKTMTAVKGLKGGIRRKAAAHLRDIFGNPFRPITFSSEWRTNTAVTLARQMYESREFGAMPILADALQDAGCSEPAILDHCRDTSLTHVRGCWVTDLVLDKS